MLPSFMLQTVNRIRAGSKIERGSVVPDWQNSEDINISGCSVQPAATSLSQDGRVLGIMDMFTLYCPATADIKAGDRIRIGSDIYTINGEPRLWPAIGVLDEHLQVNLERWQG